MSRRTRMLFLFGWVAFGAACQTSQRPPLWITELQQQDLDSVYQAIWDETMALRSTSDLSRPQVAILIAKHDEALRATLGDEHWDTFQNHYKDVWARKIYRSTRSPPSSPSMASRSELRARHRWFSTGPTTSSD